MMAGRVDCFLPRLQQPWDQPCRILFRAHQTYHHFTLDSSIKYFRMIVHSPRSRPPPLVYHLTTFRAVSSLWFLSLISSLTCALLAISLHLWTRRYLTDIRQPGTLCIQARVHEYLATGLRDSGIAVLVDVMRACHQLSFVLFAIGLSIYLSLTIPSTDAVVISWFFSMGLAIPMNDRDGNFTK